MLKIIMEVVLGIYLVVIKLFFYKLKIFFYLIGKISRKNKILAYLDFFFSSDIVSWVKERAAESVPAPKLQQITSPEIVKKECSERQLCVVTFLPLLLDCQSKCRNMHLKMLQTVSEKFKKHQWG